MWVTSKAHFVCVCECVYVLWSVFLYRYVRVVWVCRKGLVPVFPCTALFFVLSPLLYFVWHCWFLSYGEILSAFWELIGRVSVCVFEPRGLWLNARRPTLPDDPWTYLWQFWAQAVDGLQTYLFTSLRTHTVHTHVNTATIPNENVVLADMIAKSKQHAGCESYL